MKILKGKKEYFIKKLINKKTLLILLVCIILFGFWNISFAHADIWGPIFNFLGIGTKLLVKGVIGIVVLVYTAIFQFIVIPILSVMLALAGTILDYSLKFTVYGDGFSLMSTTIQSVWVLLRDTANIVFIFMLLYAAIEQIILGSIKKELLTAVITSAFLINFSLFVTRAVVDGGNIVATAVYNQIVSVPKINDTTSLNQIKAVGSFAGADAGGVDLSGYIIDGLNLVPVYDQKTSAADTQASADTLAKGGDSGLGSVSSIGALVDSTLKAILFLITIYTFLVLALLLIGRFVMLVILMATSPLGFIGNIIPGLDAKEWWKQFLNQVLIAPGLMFFMLLIIRLSKQLPYSTDNPMIVLFKYIIVVYLLIQSVNIIKKWSGPIGGIVDTVAKIAVGIAAMVATGGTAFALKQTVGRAANAASGSAGGKWLQEKAKSGGFGGFMAKGATGVMNFGKSSSYNIANTKIGSSALKSTFAGQIMNTSKVQGTGVGGFAGEQKDKLEKAKEKAQATADSFTKKQTEKGKELNKTKESITSQAKQALKVKGVLSPEENDKLKEDENNNKKELNDKTRDHASAKENYNTIMEDYKIADNDLKNIPVKNKGARAAAEAKLNDVKTKLNDAGLKIKTFKANMDNAQAKIEKYEQDYKQKMEDYKKNIETASDEIAKNMGLAGMNDLQTQIENNLKDAIQGQNKKNEFIKRQKREEVKNSLRAHTNKENTDFLNSMNEFFNKQGNPKP